jgi:sterol O-acyltransferase
MHSYMAHNGMLATVYFRLQAEKAQLAAYLDQLPGGQQSALDSAKIRQGELEAKVRAENTTPTDTPVISGINTPVDPFSKASAETLRKQLAAGASTSVSFAKEGTPEPLAAAPEIRKRNGGRKRKSTLVAAAERLPQPQPNLPLGTSLEPSHDTTPHTPTAPNPLAWSPDEHIAVLARNIDAMQDELKSNGEKGIVWPQNVTAWHFADYLIIPSLVYQLEYPRTKT